MSHLIRCDPYCAHLVSLSWSPSPTIVKLYSTAILPHVIVYTDAQDAETNAANAADREFEIATGNPLLNLQNALGQSPATPGTPASVTSSSATFAVKRRWDDDLIFKNQAAGVDDKPKKGEFVNDLLRSEFHKKFMLKWVMIPLLIFGPIFGAKESSLRPGLSGRRCWRICQRGGSVVAFMYLHMHTFRLLHLLSCKFSLCSQSFGWHYCHICSWSTIVLVLCPQ